jgi:hypothetical protein
VVKVDATLGDLKYQPRSGQRRVDRRCQSQREAEGSAGRLRARDVRQVIAKVVDVKSAPIEAKIATCSKQGCASVKAGDLVEISTSCLGGKHDICGNEETFYPPLTKVDGAYPVFTDVATFTGAASIARGRLPANAARSSRRSELRPLTAAVMWRSHAEVQIISQESRAWACCLT